MEEHVGMIANNPNYKLEELEKLYTASASPTMSPPGEDQLVNHEIRLNMSSQPGTAGVTSPEAGEEEIVDDAEILENESNHIPMDIEDDDDDM